MLYSNHTSSQSFDGEFDGGAGIIHRVRTVMNRLDSAAFWFLFSFFVAVFLSAAAVPEGPMVTSATSCQSFLAS